VARKLKSRQCCCGGSVYFPSFFYRTAKLEQSLESERETGERLEFNHAQDEQRRMI